MSQVAAAFILSLFSFGPILAEGFQGTPLGEFSELSTVHGDWKRELGTSAIVTHPGDVSRIGIHLFGAEAAIVLTLPEPQPLFGLAFDLERWTSRLPFKVAVDIRGEHSDSPWQQVFSLDEKTTVGHKSAYFASFEKTVVGVIRFRCETFESYGILLADLTLKKLKKAGQMKLLRFIPEETRPVAVPICVRGENEVIFQTAFETEGNENPVSIDRLKVEVQGSDQLASMKIQSGNDTLAQWVPVEGDNLLELKIPAGYGKNTLQLSATAKPTATVGAYVTTCISELVVDGQSFTLDATAFPVSPERRIGYYLAKPGDAGVAYYRIPGLVTTNQGTLIAVYDLRHHRGDDLPNDIDIGMSRSTDGGQTWEPIRTIMDMGGHDDNEGIGARLFWWTVTPGESGLLPCGLTRESPITIRVPVSSWGLLVSSLP